MREFWLLETFKSMTRVWKSTCSTSGLRWETFTMFSSCNGRRRCNYNVPSLLFTVSNFQEFIQKIKLSPCLSTTPWKYIGGTAPSILNHDTSCISQNYPRHPRPDSKSEFLNRWGEVDHPLTFRLRLRMCGAFHHSSTNPYGKMLRQRNNLSPPYSG